MKKIFILTLTIFTFLSCKKEKASNPAPGTNPFNLVKATANDSPSTNKTLYNLAVNPVIKFSFSAPINKSTAAGNIGFVSGNTVVANNYSFSNGDSSLIIQPTTALNHLTNYTVSVVGIKSVADSALKTVAKLSFVTSLDSTDKFPQISDSALLTLVQQQTFKYFYDFGHPVSGLARERNSSADVVTTGGSGFGVMAILVGIQRNFISHAEGLARINLIVNFLISKAQRYHGAFPHWMNGATGATIPFTAQDDGADLVETSYMIEGLLCARQFFNSTTDPDEISLRTNINSIYNGVEWNWFRQNGQ
ncbi:MAG: Ig-like domain-containing protein, partial [Bacteroidota bacterium]|nr:Ig-like domain-containing protein [Bacteroidota bacterium]